MSNRDHGRGRRPELAAPGDRAGRRLMARPGIDARGSGRSARSSWSMIAEPTRQRSGQVHGVLGIKRDVTATYRVEPELSTLGRLGRRPVTANPGEDRPVGGRRPVPGDLGHLGADRRRGRRAGLAGGGARPPSGYPLARPSCPDRRAAGRGRRTAWPGQWSAALPSSRYDRKPGRGWPPSAYAGSPRSGSIAMKSSSAC